MKPGAFDLADVKRRMQGSLNTLKQELGGLRTGRATQARDITRELAPPPPHQIKHLSSFGEDAQGELYLVEHMQGAIFRLIPRQ